MEVWIEQWQKDCVGVGNLSHRSMQAMIQTLLGGFNKTDQMIQGILKAEGFEKRENEQIESCGQGGFGCQRDQS